MMVHTKWFEADQKEWPIEFNADAKKKYRANTLEFLSELWARRYFFLGGNDDGWMEHYKEHYPMIDADIDGWLDLIDQYRYANEMIGRKLKQREREALKEETKARGYPGNVWAAKGKGSGCCAGMYPIEVWHYVCDKDCLL
jgi:hypothetical protein